MYILKIKIVVVIKETKYCALSLLTQLPLLFKIWQKTQRLFKNIRFFLQYAETGID